ncbi:MAG: pyridoxal phosphate-dependent aminotransferase family protein, partial [Maribacter sp.]|nr:pyridoxal phosphate-dependent aminotransferase family protein [Maribacter sp.]
MARFPKKLRLKLIDREKENALRDLPIPNTLVDFSSNDYLGLSKNQKIFDSTSELLKNRSFDQNGATGSRLLSGNHSLYGQLENVLKEFHEVTSALVFNSGYDANIGFFGAVPQRGDVVFYDEYIHASIRDGIIMGNAKSYKFRHNDLEDLAQKCHALGNRNPKHGEVYVVTESIFSMDGDSPDLNTLVEYCRVNDFHLIIDEAHAVGVVGEKGKGLVQKLGLQDR